MSNRKKVLIVYFSSTGNTRFIAQEMAEAVDGDLFELVPKKKMNVSGIGYVGWGITQLIKKSERELAEIPENIGDYDLIIVGSPVWSYTLNPAVRTFLKETDFYGKNVAVFCCHGGQKGHTLQDMISEMEGANCLGEIDFKEPLNNEKMIQAEKAQQWVKTLL